MKSEFVDEWLAERPPMVRKLLSEFPVGTEVDLKGERWYVIGALDGFPLDREEETLLISPIRPSYQNDTEIHRKMLEQRIWLHAYQLRDGKP